MKKFFTAALIAFALAATNSVAAEQIALSESNLPSLNGDWDGRYSGLRFYGRSTLHLRTDDSGGCELFYTYRYGQGERDRLPESGSATCIVQHGSIIVPQYNHTITLHREENGRLVMKGQQTLSGRYQAWFTWEGNVLLAEQPR